jgi:CRP/FNR family transcriptional regulator, cyclic AMP receptor protein
MDPIPPTPIRLASHRHCIALSRLFRGKLCDQLSSQSGRRFASGQFIYLRGDPAQSVYFLREGLVRSSIITQNGQEVIIAVYKRGEVFGELCLCSGERREQATAMEPTEVVEIQLAELIARLQSDRQKLFEFIANVCHHLAGAYDQIQVIAVEKTPARVARQLLQLAVEFGKPTTAGIEIGPYIRQEELAQMVGATREVVSLCLNHLRASGSIRYYRKGRITVIPKALEDYLQSQ